MLRTALPVGLLLALAAQAQTLLPEFDAATLKVAQGVPAKGVSTRPRGGPGTSDPGRFSVQYLPLKNLMMLAFDKAYDEIVGLDAATERYTVEATMPALTTNAEFRLMLQRLLRERLRLTVHAETREFPAYELAIAKGGPRLTPWKPGQAESSSPEGFPRLPAGEAGKAAVLVSGDPPMMRSSHRQTMKQFAVGLTEMVREAHSLAPDEKRPRVVDKTGLTDVYEFRLEHEFAIPRKGSTVAGDPGGNSINLFRALEKELGLKLVRRRNIAVEVLVVDHADKVPAEN
jgi:uncharacterized protein (TIGR03435 family)